MAGWKVFFSSSSSFFFFIIIFLVATLDRPPAKESHTKGRSEDKIFALEKKNRLPTVNQAAKSRLKKKKEEEDEREKRQKRSVIKS